MRFLCGTIVVLSTLLLIVTVATWDGRRTITGPTLGEDYVQFHAVGLLLRQSSGSRLYDRELQASM